MVAREARYTSARQAAQEPAGRCIRQRSGRRRRSRRPGPGAKAAGDPGRSLTAWEPDWVRLSLLIQVRAFGPRAVGGGWGVRRWGAGPHHPPAPMWPARPARAPPEHQPPEQGEFRAAPDHRQRAGAERGRGRHGRDRRQVRRGAGTSTHLEGRSARRTGRRTHTRNPSCTEPATAARASLRRPIGDARTTAAEAKTAWRYPPNLRKA
jgi:hypothetical protein